MEGVEGLGVRVLHPNHLTFPPRALDPKPQTAYTSLKTLLWALCVLDVFVLSGVRGLNFFI